MQHKKSYRNHYTTQVNFWQILKIIALWSSSSWNKLLFPQNSYSVSILAAANSTGEGIVPDPCIPKGYILETNLQKDLPGFLADKGKFTATLQAAGNFSECRSAAFAMLQEEKGKSIIVGIGEYRSCVQFSYGCSFGTFVYREMYL